MDLGLLNRWPVKPFIGKQGKLEKTNEIRIETIIPESLQKKVINAMLKVHPYEEVAYDIYPLENQGKKFGLGRIGYTKEPVILKDFVKLSNKSFAHPMLDWWEI